MLTNFHRDEAKKNQNQNKIQNGRLKKTEFFKIANSQYFFVKISWIGLRVAFSQKRLMRLSFLQTDEPNYFPELEF